MSLESTIRMMTESKVVKEDGHTDVASAKRQCKTAMEDAQAIIGVLDGMNDEDALPTWWTNKLAIAANSMNKLNDYLSNPTEQKEEIEMEDLDNLIEEALNEEVKYPHMMYDPETGEGVEAKTPEDHDKLAKKGYTHEKPELDEAPKMKYALVGKDMKIYSMGSDERDLRLDRRSLEKRFKDVAPLKMARLKTAQKIGDTVDKSQLKEETVNEHTHYKMEPFGVSRSLVDSVKAVLAGKPNRENIPEEILDDDVADFIGAASKAAAAGKKKFKFGDKEYPVTIKKSTADKVSKKMDEAVKKEEDEEPADDKKAKDKKDEKNGKKEPIEIDPEIKEELDIIEMADADFDAYIEDLSEEQLDELIGAIGRGLKKAGSLAVKGAKKAANRMSTSGRADAAQAKLAKIKKKKADKARLAKAKSDIAKEKATESKEVKEAEMTDAQMARREEIVKELKKKEDEFKERYGDKWKEVMYATATKMAMKEAKK